MWKPAGGCAEKGDKACLSDFMLAGRQTGGQDDALRGRRWHYIGPLLTGWFIEKESVRSTCTVQRLMRLLCPYSVPGTLYHYRIRQPYTLYHYLMPYSITIYRVACNMTVYHVT